ncbi:DNA replication protein psf1 [Tilletia horrida]|uniref:DNA replication complex GINS protein PSF1 n=1 Tax=Tilletia horrida TaxID=155126 RepID=A0AAN6JKS1_9BASI|nr:DNA replication protein psf1 [Tilletia horrida]KAK0531701.1 DNA replication protein psf1 [Tilletia horrida]KAK0533204.1 DNA replication protein psf1 [Tilletia horrida]KAK0563010.1 DNA replication protein psf1 [Tilletia horrida]
MLGDQATKLITEAKLADATNSFRPYDDETVRLVLLETRQLQTQMDEILANYGGDTEAVEPDSPAEIQLLTFHIASQRNKRCLLAYHHHRTEALKSLLWDCGGAINLVLDGDAPERATGPQGESSRGAAANASAGVRNRLSPAELNWLRSYASLVTAYKSEYLDTLDLTSSLASGAAHYLGAAVLLTEDDSALGGAGGSGGDMLSLSGSSANSIAALAQAQSFNVGPPTDLFVTVVAQRDARNVLLDSGDVLNLQRGHTARLRRTDIEGLILRGWLTVIE